MSPALPSGAAASLRTALSLVGLAASCSFRPAPEWSRVLADVRARNPGVVHVAPHDLAEELRAQPAERAPLLLDARAEEEFATSHLLGARSTPDESAALEVLRGVAPERAVVVYCSVGLRSSDLAEALRARGFTRVANLEGGIFAWANAGLPTYRGEEREDRVHPYDARWGTLLAAGRRAP